MADLRVRVVEPLQEERDPIPARDPPQSQSGRGPDAGVGILEEGEEDPGSKVSLSFEEALGPSRVIARAWALWGR